MAELIAEHTGIMRIYMLFGVLVQISHSAKILLFSELNHAPEDIILRKYPRRLKKN